MRFCVSLTIAAIIIVGCSKNESTEPGGEPQEIPPISSFLLDFNDFPLSSTETLSANGTMKSLGILSHDNWGWAALNVVVWQTLVTVGMVVPVAAFLESFNHEPEQQPDGAWVWTYHFTIPGGIQHTALLHADVDNLGIRWDMYISKQNEYTDFLCYAGSCDLLVTEGTWTVNRHPENPSPWIGIEWHRNPQDNTADIKYTNIIPNGPENGGFIFYGTITDATYDAFYDIYNIGQDNHTDIRWNRTTLSGKVMDQNYFADDAWHCWDENLEDVECP